MFVWFYCHSVRVKVIMIFGMLKKILHSLQKTYYIFVKQQTARMVVNRSDMIDNLA